MSSLYEVISPIDQEIIKKGNAKKSWAYGYNPEHDLVVISKDGTIGDVYLINHVKIALPSKPKSVENKDNRWTPSEYPKELQRVKSIFDWNSRDNSFKNKWVDYIEQEFIKRDNGHWFINNGLPTYITGSHYVYLQWTKIDVGLPEFRESNRIFFIYWEACKADSRCYGMCYLKNRRSGFSFMASGEIVNEGTITKRARFGILSKTGADAKIMFTDKVVPISANYPFFFKPIQDGMDRPKTELAYRMPAKKITRNNMDENDEELEGLDSSIDWKNTADNSYDGEKLRLLVHDESGKWEKPVSITANWRVTKTCLRLGARIIGKCMMGSTSNALSKGGQQFKDIYYDSNPKERNANGQTKSGLYALFIPMEWNYEGYIDEFGWPVIETPKKPVRGIDGGTISIGVVDYWNNEVAGLKSDSDALNEFYRQYPRTESHAFRDESRQSLFNLTKIYQQIDYNDSMRKHGYVVRGNFHWKDGKQDTQVVWTPEDKGRFWVSWIPPLKMRNGVAKKGDKFFPLNDSFGAFGCDPYDISGAISGGSNGALHGLTKFSMDPDVPSNMFFLEYIARPQTAEMFFEDVLMACVFYGMPILAENNKPRLLYHFKNRGYRAFAMNRPDKHSDKLSKTEKEIGGIPSSSEDMKQAHASMIETYIEKYVGYDMEGTYRSPDDVGDMLFTRTLEDWAKFDILDRTKHDASISSGLALMACNKNSFLPEVKKSKISINFAKYDNSGSESQIVRG